MQRGGTTMMSGEIIPVEVEEPEEVEYGHLHGGERISSPLPMERTTTRQGGRQHRRRRRRGRSLCERGRDDKPHGPTTVSILIAFCGATFVASAITVSFFGLFDSDNSLFSLSSNNGGNNNDDGGGGGGRAGGRRDERLGGFHHHSRRRMEEVEETFSTTNADDEIRHPSQVSSSYLHGTTTSKNSSSSSPFAEQGGIKGSFNGLVDGLLDLDDDTMIDYTTKSCEHLTQYTTHHNRAKQCSYAKQCNEGEGIVFPFVYCSTSYGTRTLGLVFAPGIVLLLLLLFRMVASTAEDYFSPSLEMFSFRMGLPTRFAGVTLLALGNGAPDVAATVNAIRDDKQIGYLMSLGELTGSAMFIGTVIAGVVVVVSPNGCIPCHRPLVRDVVMFFATLIVVYEDFDFQKAITGRSIRLWMGMYLGYVLVVMLSDLYHKKIVVPRLDRLIEGERRREEARKKGRRGRKSGGSIPDGSASVSGEEADSAAGLRDDSSSSDVSDQTPTNESTNLLPKTKNAVRRLGSGCLSTSEPHHHLTLTNPLESLIEAVSNYAPEEAYEDAKNSHQQAVGGGRGRGEGVVPQHHRTSDGWGEKDSDGEEPLVVVHPHHGGVTSLPPPRLVRDQDVSSWSIPSRPSSVGGASRGGADYDEVTFSTDWKSAVVECREEARRYWQDVWDDIYRSERHWFNQFLLSCELPFTVLRMATVPIPCDGYYSRPTVALSTTLSPLWLRFYFSKEYGINIFDQGVLSLCIILVPICLGILVVRYAPSGDGPMRLSFSGPLALYGFLVAATWIDVVADELVDVLSFVGILCHIPSAIMGLTVLAVGNSIGDLSANVSVAKKGLSDMAITACFAGPVFNMLVGLSLGFSALRQATGLDAIEVQLTPPLKAGFFGSIVNCILIIAMGVCWGRGTLGKEYGYAALTLYVAYAIASLVV